MKRNDVKNYKENMDNMSLEKLEQQVARNKRRMVGNGAVLGSVAVGSLFVCPPIAVVPLGIGVLRIYWLNQNNKQLDRQIDKQLTLTRKK